MLLKAVLSAKIGGIHWDITPSDSYIINPNRIKEMKVYDTNKSQFVYLFSPENDRTDHCIFQCTTTVANIIIAADASPDSSHVALRVFEDDDTTESAVVTYFRVDDIAFVEAYGTNRSWAFISHGGNSVKRYLVNYNLDQIMDMAGTGTTTTTTTTSTTSTTTD
jgi:hypothetical protein